MLWLKYLKHSPADPDWADRDRFVLSGGHGSMLLYSLLHLAGYELSLEELKQFRQWGSRTPGHPESGHTPGVETTTGPLGQGCANGVGMALAERMLAERFNVGEATPVDHYTYVFAGDGDMMEGISHEAFSLAGHLGLNKLIVFYDFNEITIEGKTDLAYSEDVKKRFQSYNWNVIDIDAHDYDQIERAIRRARREKTRPTIVICRSHIGYGSPNKQDTASAHGEPLGSGVTFGAASTGAGSPIAGSGVSRVFRSSRIRAWMEALVIAAMPRCVSGSKS
jgi:transketolase